MNENLLSLAETLTEVDLTLKITMVLKYLQEQQNITINLLLKEIPMCLDKEHKYNL